MAKKGANKETSNNQLVYYVLFFVLGAIFAAGILAINDGLSGRVIEEFSSDQFALAIDASSLLYKEAYLSQIESASYEEYIIRLHELIEQGRILVGEENPLGLEFYEHTAAVIVDEAISARANADEINALIEAKFGTTIQTTPTFNEGTREWNIATTTINGQIFTVKLQDLGTFEAQGGEQAANARGDIVAGITQTYKGRTVAIIINAGQLSNLDFSSDNEGHSFSEGDEEDPALSSDNEGHLF